MIHSRLPISIHDLLNPNVVELDRLEFKEGWNPDATIPTLCAFANDFHNIGGGYIVIGVKAIDGQPQLPPAGVKANQIDLIERELLQYCNQIKPFYFPIFCVEQIQGKTVIVLWAPGGQNRPYKAPDSVVTKKDKRYHYYIRQYSNTVIARDERERELIQLTATVPFDDRTNQRADLADLKLPLIQAFLKEIGSSLYPESGKMPFEELCQSLAIADGGQEWLKPRNVGLMFFSDDPERYFPGARIELVEFPKGVAGGELEEKIFRGPLHQQVRDAITSLMNNVHKKRTIKLPDRAEAQQIVNYPHVAIEESLVNAVYHRGYDVREPIEVRVNPDCIEILSFPGPVPSVNMRELKRDRVVVRTYRNRRVGEFLKELKLTEGRGTGIPDIRRSMKENGSPEPVFETDEERTYFLTRIPVHPAWLEAQVEAQVKAQVDLYQSLNETEKRLLELLQTVPFRSSEIIEAFGYKTMSGSLKKALERLENLDLIALTIPDKPKSRNQRRMLTEKGRNVLETGKMSV